MEVIKEKEWYFQVLPVVATCMGEGDQNNKGELRRKLKTYQVGEEKAIPQQKW